MTGSGFNSSTAYLLVYLGWVTTLEMNVINVAKSWKRSEDGEKRKHWEKMLRIAVEHLEECEKRSKRTSAHSKRRRTPLTLVK